MATTKAQGGGKAGSTKAGSKGDAGEGKAAGDRKPNALQRPLRPSKELAAVVGPGPLPRAEAVSKVWGYIKANGLQDPKDRREIVADAKLEAVFGAKRATMFEMSRHLARHLT